MEACLSWLSQWRGLLVRYEKKASNYLGIATGLRASVVPAALTATGPLRIHTNPSSEIVPTTFFGMVFPDILESRLFSDRASRDLSVSTGQYVRDSTFTPLLSSLL